jgi:hypothetical protein
MPQIVVSNISYYTSLLLLKVLTFPVLHISGALWVPIDNVLFQSALIVIAGEHPGQAF